MLLPFNFRLLCWSSANPDDSNGNSAKPKDNSAKPDQQIFLSM